MASLRGYRNSLLPIHRLPPELLTEIFRLTMSSPESFCPWFEYDHVPKPPPKVQNWSLLHVCRHWRGIMATSPNLWSTVDSLCHPESFLKRAGGAPHRIFISDGNNITPTLLEALTAEPQRLAEYHVWGGGGQAIWKLLNAGSAPLLEALTLILNAGITNPVLPPIFQGNMPRLKKLALSYYTSWPSGYFKGLTHLYLCTQAQTRPTTSEFLDFLEGSPLLEVLSLDIAGPTRDNISEIPPTPASRFVDLKHLKELNIAGWPTITIIARFLSHLCLPPTTNMYIWGMCLTNIDEDLGLLLPHDPSRLQNLQTIRRLVISRHPAIQHKTPPFVVIENATLHIFGTLSPRHIIPIMSRYPLDKVRRFTIWDSFHGPSDGIPTQVWYDFFQKMPSLRSLHIIRSPSTTGLTRSVVSALLPPHEKKGDKEKTSEKTTMTTMSDDDTQPHPNTILCPHLRTLTIEGDPKLPTLLLGALAQDRSNRSTPLKKIEITTNKYASTPNDLSPLSSETDNEDKNGMFTTEDVYFLKKHVRDVIFTQKIQHGETVLIPPELGGRLFKWIRTLYASVITPS